MRCQGFLKLYHTTLTIVTMGIFPAKKILTGVIVGNLIKEERKKKKKKN